MKAGAEVPITTALEMCSYGLGVAPSTVER